MVGIPTPFGGGDADRFDGYDEFVPEHVPSPGAFLEGHDVLTGEDHVAFHGLTRDLFEERTVYDMTFDYNLARLNLDPRHPDAGYRYAEAADDASVLRAEFTPTTPFCPQTHTLTVASFRAWNGLAGRHGYDLVRVGVAETHHRSEAINERLAALASEYEATGTVPDAPPGDGVESAPAGSVGSSPGGPRPPF